MGLAPNLIQQNTQVNTKHKNEVVLLIIRGTLSSALDFKTEVGRRLIEVITVRFQPLSATVLMFNTVGRMRGRHAYSCRVRHVAISNHVLLQFHFLLRFGAKPMTIMQINEMNETASIVNYHGSTCQWLGVYGAIMCQFDEFTILSCCLREYINKQMNERINE